MLLPKPETSNPFLPSVAPTTSLSVTNPFQSRPPYTTTSCPSHCSTGLNSLWLILGRDRAHIPFRLSELKEIKKDLGSYNENLDQYIQAFKEVSQNFKMSWKDIMILLSQTLTSLEKQ
jgi:hypothetical protein